MDSKPSTDLTQAYYDLQREREQLIHKIRKGDDLYEKSKKVRKVMLFTGLYIVLGFLFLYWILDPAMAKKPDRSEILLMAFFAAPVAAGFLTYMISDFVEDHYFGELAKRSNPTVQRLEAIDTELASVIQRIENVSVR